MECSLTFDGPPQVSVTPRWFTTFLVLAAVAAMATLPAAAVAGVRVLAPTSRDGVLVTFDLRALRGASPVAARVRTGDRSDRISAARLRSALHRGVMRVRLAGRPKPKTARSARLIVTTAACPATASAYADAVAATPGVVALWRLGEASGPTACDRIGADPGRYVGDVALGQAGALPGDPDTAAAFRGSGAAVRIPSARSLSPRHALTLEAWVKPSATGGFRAIADKAKQYLLGIADGRVVFRVWRSARRTTVLRSRPVVDAGTWQHVVATYDGRSMHVYRDGVQVAGRARTGVLRRTPAQLRLAPSADGSGAFRGDLDEVALYRRALTPSAVSAHSAGTMSPPSSPPTPTPRTTADVFCGLGSFAAGNWPTACWRPYADSSPFNQPLPPAPRLLPNSESIVQRVLGMGPIADLVVAPDTASDWYHPTYYSHSGDPAYVVHCVKYACPIEGLTVRIPVPARPAAGGDGHMTVVDQATGWEWDFWQVAPRSATGGTLTISAGGRTAITGDGLNSQANAGQWGLLGGIIRAQELQAGRIDHALFMMVGCTHSGHVYPAGGNSDICADQANAPRTGERFQLAMSADEIQALAVPEWKKTILRALATYGAYVGDTGGNEAFTFQFESGSTYTSFGVADPLAAFAATNQGPDVKSVDGKWYFDLGSGVDWAGRLRVVDPCVTQETC